MISNLDSSYIRAVHNSENQYTQMNNRTIRDPNLSMEAKCLLLIIFSHSDEWTINPQQIYENSKEGKSKIYKLFRELIDQGYCLRMTSSDKDEKGKFVSKRVHYVFFEVKATEEDMESERQKFKKCFRNLNFGDLRYGNLRNGDNNNTEETRKTNFKKKQQQPPLPPRPSKSPPPKPSHPPHPMFGENPTDPLLLFFLKHRGKLSPDQQVLCWLYFEENGKDARNPEGWLRSSIVGRWWENAPKSKEVMERENEEFARRVRKIFPSFQLGYNYLDMLSAGKYFKFDDRKFKDKVLKELRKSNKDISLLV